MEPVPICDIVNTLKKMAQKRAMVGAVITAVGASDYFTQDEDEIANQRGDRGPKKANAPDFTNSSDAGDYVCKVNKFKNKRIKEIPTKDLNNYLNWATENVPNPEGPMLEFINKARDFLKGAK